MIKKTCKACKDDLPISMFGVNNDKPDGFQITCTDCLKIAREKLKPLKELRQTDFIVGENWRPILNYEGIYEVSNLGRIRSVDRFISWEGNHPVLKRGQLLINRPKPLLKNQYMKQTLCKNGTRRYKNIHIAVAESFVENTYHKPFVNHINGIKNDNRAINLEWVTAKENTRHAMNLGTIDMNGEKCNFSKLTNTEVLEIREIYRKSLKFYKSTAEFCRWLCEKYNVSDGCIRQVVVRKTFKHI